MTAAAILVAGALIAVALGMCAAVLVGIRDETARSIDRVAEAQVRGAKAAESFHASVLEKLLSIALTVRVDEQGRMIPPATSAPSRDAFRQPTPDDDLGQGGLRAVDQPDCGDAVRDVLRRKPPEDAS